jgi:hypothetical protein
LGNPDRNDEKAVQKELEQELKFFKKEEKEEKKLEAEEEDDDLSEMDVEFYEDEEADKDKGKFDELDREQISTNSKSNTTIFNLPTLQSTSFTQPTVLIPRRQLASTNTSTTTSTSTATTTATTTTTTTQPTVLTPRRLTPTNTTTATTTTTQPIKPVSLEKPTLLIPKQQPLPLTPFLSTPKPSNSNPPGQKNAIVILDDDDEASKEPPTKRSKLKHVSLPPSDESKLDNEILKSSIMKGFILVQHHFNKRMAVGQHLQANYSGIETAKSPGSIFISRLEASNKSRGNFSQQKNPNQDDIDIIQYVLDAYTYLIKNIEGRLRVLLKCVKKCKQVLQSLITDDEKSIIIRDRKVDFSQYITSTIKMILTFQTPDPIIRLEEIGTDITPMDYMQSACGLNIGESLMEFFESLLKDFQDFSKFEALYIQDDTIKPWRATAKKLKESNFPTNNQGTSFSGNNTSRNSTTNTDISAHLSSKIGSTMTKLIERFKTVNIQ